MISPISMLDSTATAQNVNKQKTSDSSFNMIFNTVKGLINENITMQNKVNDMTTDFLTGKSDNITGLMIAQEKSNELLQYSLQLRKGVLDAYNEIIKMSI